MDRPSLLAVLVVAGHAASVGAQTFIWTCGPSGSWSDATCWNTGSVPSAFSATAVIGPGDGVQSSGPAMVGALDLGNGAALTVVREEFLLGNLAGPTRGGSAAEITVEAPTPGVVARVRVDQPTMFVGPMTGDAFVIRLRGGVGPDQATFDAGAGSAFEGRIEITGEGYIVGSGVYAPPTTIIATGPTPLDLFGTNNIRGEIVARGGTPVIRGNTALGNGGVQTGAIVLDGSDAVVENARIEGGSVRTGPSFDDNEIRLVNATLADVQLDAPAAVPGGSTARIQDAMANNAVLTINPGGASAPAILEIDADNPSAPVPILGAGFITLNAPSEAELDFAMIRLDAGEPLRLGPAQTINGTGVLAGSQAVLTNDGRITADVIGRTILINVDTFNNSVIESVLGPIELRDCVIEQIDPAVIRHVGANVIIENAQIKGGDIAGGPTGTGVFVRGDGSLEDTTITGNIIVTDGTLELRETNTNSGCISLEPFFNPDTGSATAAVLRAADFTTTLLGTGTLKCTPESGSRPLIDLGLGRDLVNGAEHTIMGDFDVFGSSTSVLINQGAIEIAPGATATFTAEIDNSGRIAVGANASLTLDTGFLDQRDGGVIDAASGAKVSFTDGAQVRAGRFEGPGDFCAAGELVVQSTFTGRFELEADLTLKQNATLRANSEFRLGVANTEAELVLSPQGPSGTPPTLFADSVGARITGSGTVRLLSDGSGSRARIDGATGARWTFAGTMRVAGVGDLLVETVYEGDLVPQGVITASAPITLRSSATLAFLPQAADPFGNADTRIVSSSTVNLAGTLFLNLLAFAGVDDGTEITLISAANISGMFDPQDVIISAPAGYDVEFIGDANTFGVRLVCTDESAGCTPGCGLADLVAPFGITDLDDVDAFIPLFLAGDPAADFVPPMGIVDLDDLDAFITAFLAGCP